MTGVKLSRILRKVLSESRSHCNSDIGINIDFANCKRRSLAKHILGNADCIGHLAAEFVDNLNVILVYGRSAVKNDREAGKLFAYFVKNIKAKLGILAGLKFVCAV